MDIVLVGLMSLTAMMVGGLFGALFVAPFESSGPRPLFGHFLFATFFALFVPVIPVLIWGMEVYLNPYDDKLNIAMFGSGAAAMVLTAFGIWTSAPSRIKEYLEMVQKVKPFVLKNFAVLDGDEDGVISDGDLGHAAEEKLITDESDRKVLDFVRGHLGSIGHGVGSYRTYNAATKTTSSHTVSVISPRDVEGFAERELAKYAAWQQ